MDALRCFVSKTPTFWDDYLPQIAGVLRLAVNRSTDYTPNTLGMEGVQPLDVVSPFKLSPESIDPESSTEH